MIGEPLSPVSHDNELVQRTASVSACFAFINIRWYKFVAHRFEFVLSASRSTLAYAVVRM